MRFFRLKMTGLVGAFALVLGTAACVHDPSPKSLPQQQESADQSKQDKTKLGGESSGYIAGIAPTVQTAGIPECKPQRNAPPEQLAPSYFEDMQSCRASLPPQLSSASKTKHIGSLDVNGDCNLGTVGSTEVVCHYHSGFEFTSKNTAPADPTHLVEVHCIAFKLDAGKRLLTPIVFGTQLVCKDSAMSGHKVSSGAHGNECGAGLAGLFDRANDCDMRCCRDGSLTNAHPKIDVRPSFGICATPTQEMDCASVLTAMHPHPPHRPHDRVGPVDLYGAPKSMKRDKKLQLKK